MEQELIRRYKQQKGIDDLEQAKDGVRGESGAAMHITPGPAMGWADTDGDRDEVFDPDEKYWNAKWPEREQQNGSSESQRQLLTDANR